MYSWIRRSIILSAGLAYFAIAALHSVSFAADGWGKPDAPPAEIGKFDGKWIGFIEQEPSAYCGPFFERRKTIKATVAGRKFSGVFDHRGVPVHVAADISAVGSFSIWFPLILSPVKPGDNLNLEGNFDGNRFSGSFRGSSTGHFIICSGSFDLARKGTLEADALVSGESLDVLVIQKKIAKLSREKGAGKVKPAKKSTAKKPKSINGNWAGLARMSGDAECTLPGQIKSAVVGNGRYSISLLDAKGTTTLTGGVDRDGQISEWHKFNVVRSSGGGGAEEIRFKLEGQFTPGTFSGSLNGAVDDDRGVCSGDIVLAREGSVEAEALYTGRDAKMIRLERQLAELEKSKGDGNAKNEADLKALELARRESEQKAQKAKDDLEKIRRKQKIEAQRLAKLEAEARRRAKQVAALKKREADLRRRNLAQGKRNAEARRQSKRRYGGINFGDYHALIIGINDYKNFSALKTAVADAQSVAKILKGSFAVCDGVFERA